MVEEVSHLLLHISGHGHGFQHALGAVDHRLDLGMGGASAGLLDHNFEKREFKLN